ncbi:MAG TPA: bifunctional UDP-N-acetylmuramoyl-tripeptide:D-alanyl-D-alanine ligase/alanine racemase [Saprospiraceae bacterium]|nr:bifunctional UDP-N-acetylmuramoyl-tripeptide:D-alanyl-D-alanine ligase/alanine racemase [Saprospiraceae bacterium]
MFTAFEFAELADTPVIWFDKEWVIDKISIDTRKIIKGDRQIFFCLKGVNRDGHDFISEAYAAGVRNFVVNKNYPNAIKNANFFIADDVLKTLQLAAKNHLSNFDNLQVITITGSNGKTIVKEWLYHFLSRNYSVFKSPGSYNSSIGVPLSILQIEHHHKIAIIEVGISAKGEMSTMCDILSPDMGLITNIGDAHDSGFDSMMEKLEEKLKIFENSDTLFYCHDHELISNTILQRFREKKQITWGNDSSCFTRITSMDHSIVSIRYPKGKFKIPVKKEHFHFENLMHCVNVALSFGIDPEHIRILSKNLPPLEMRLEQLEGIHDCLIINDAYVADYNSLTLALDHAFSEARGRSTCLILSDFAHIEDPDKYTLTIEKLLNSYPLKKLITVGKISSRIQGDWERYHYADMESLNRIIDQLPWKNEVIVIKGAREFRLHQLVSRLEKKGHSAQLEIDVSAIKHNFQFYNQLLPLGSTLIPVIKAAAYGSGIEIIAHELAALGPEMMAVANLDEAIHLRNEGIRTRLIIFNADPEKPDSFFRYQLEPSVHHLTMLSELATMASERQQSLRVHIKLDTGMHRLGFTRKEIPGLIQLLKYNPWIEADTVFSHLSATDDPEKDGYTHHQLQNFTEFHEQICQGLQKNIKRHILNSDGIIRFPQYTFEYSRIGIGLYGISAFAKKTLEKVHTLSARVISVKKLKKGDALGYNLSEILDRDAKVAVINLGYADGFMRIAGNRNSSVWYEGQRLPVIGNICMDVAFIDVSTAPNIRLGDPVEIFGKNIGIETLAGQLNTIPYEILTRIAPRVVRRYVYK